MVIETELIGKDSLKGIISGKNKSRKKPADPDPPGLEAGDNDKPNETEARESRGHWKHPLDFLFSCISVSVGLGSKCESFTGKSQKIVPRFVGYVLKAIVAFSGKF